MLLLLACSSGSVSLGDDTAAEVEDSAPPDDSAPPEDTSPENLDGDPADSTTDCDDRDPNVYPGADEAWNDADDDCDGIVDADGAWTGTLHIDAQAVFEGHLYTFDLDCPFSGTRADGTFDWSVDCSPDPDDEDAQRLLGASLVLTPDDPEVDGDAWDGTVIVTSSGGWDTDGEGSIDWDDFDAADVAIDQSSLSLAFSGRGGIDRN